MTSRSRCVCRICVLCVGARVRARVRGSQWVLCCGRTHSHTQTQTRTQTRTQTQTHTHTHTHTHSHTQIFSSLPKFS